jgi:hypothetical protein
MTNIVPPLDQSRSYTYCPLCAQAGNKTELRRDQHRLVCDLGHAFQYSQIQKMGTPPEMIKTHVIEQPSPHSIPVKIFVHPETWRLINERYSGQLHVTLGTVMDALADGSIVFITGDDARKLREMGVKNSAEMVAAVEARKDVEKERDELQKVVEKLQPLLAAAGVGTIL